MKVISVNLREAILEQTREVNLLLLGIIIDRNPNAGKVGLLERLRDVRREKERGGIRERSAFRSPPPRKAERSRELRFGNLLKRREIGDDHGLVINLKEYTKVLLTENSCFDTRDKVST
jgi:hypothetical protein